MAKKQYKIVYLGGPLNGKRATVTVLQKTIFDVASKSKYVLLDPVYKNSMHIQYTHRYQYKP